jgi:hypothetical protein
LAAVAAVDASPGPPSFGVNDVSFVPPLPPPPLDPRLAMMGGIIVCTRGYWQFPLKSE